MKWYKNLLLEWVESATEKSTERVLAVPPGATEVVLIRVFDPRANPRLEQVELLEAALHTGNCRVLTADPYSVIEPDEDSIPQNLRAKRDRAFAAITPLLDLPGTDQFFGRQRGELIRRTSRDKKISKRLIYAYLRRFWQRGQRKNALLPDYDRCGAPGKIRQHSSAKRGRPPEIVSDLGPGINIGEKEQHLILRGFKRFYLNTNGTKPSLRKAYELTLTEFFNEGYEIKRGERLPVMPPREELPSFRQFQYWVSKEPDLSEILKIREGDRRFNLRYRALGGDARAGADGPGSEYQIDATPADITLISSLDRRRVIGRPNIYFLVDVFSGMIAGFSATLEHNSYFAAMLALECAIRDKVEFCAEHGITIEADEWPCFGLPDKITADRGELIGKKANQLVTALGIHVSNTPPYRADLKPFVERSFRTLNDELLSLVPGSIKKQRERGDRDTRLDAVFTAEELRKQIILFILNHNRSRVEKMKPRDFMVSADLEPRPIALWNWGVIHRSGHLRRFDPQTTRVNLLPVESGRVTEQGIRFRKLFFTCERAVAGQWFTKARAKGSWSVEVSYDPRCASVAYVRNSDGKTADPCKLLEAYSSFQNCTWDEIDDFFAAGRQQAIESQHRCSANCRLPHAKSEACG